MARVTPSPGRGIFLAFGARHIQGVAVSRWVAAVCFVIAGAVVVAFGHWWGLVFFGAAALNGSLAYLVPRWNLLRDAPKNVERVRELQRSRALVVDDAAARLRRIEQDLHDGAQVPERPSPAIETIAYFCVAELLTNAAKHSGAQRVRLEVLHQPGLVAMRVSDDGTGGARLEPGGGLAGLAERVKTVDGRLRVESPAGGPTIVTVELPSHV